MDGEIKTSENGGAGMSAHENSLRAANGVGNALNEPFDRLKMSSSEISTDNDYFSGGAI